MAEEGVQSEKQEPSSDGNAEVEKSTGVDQKIEALTDETKAEELHVVTEIGEDKSDEGRVEDQKMDVDTEELKETEEKAEEEKFAQEGENKGNEETEGDKEKQDSSGEYRGKEEMDEGTEEKTNKDTEEKAEKEADGEEEEEVKPKEEKASKKRPRSKTSAGINSNSNKKEPMEKEKEEKASSGRKEKKTETPVERKEPKTPVISPMDRPVRERKSVKRLVATIENDSSKDFHIEKGRGTALKNIPNVAYKLSKKKNEDTLKLLHTILYGRRGKAAQVKNNISRFSGFVWHDNEDKQMIKLKEKLDKCVKEILVEFCDVLDMPISKTNPKEDIIAKLIEFLVEPNATTSELIAEKEQGKKRKRTVKSEFGSTSRGSVKSRKKAGNESKKGEDTESIHPESEDESEEEKVKAAANGVPEKSDDEMSEKTESEDKQSESEEESDEEKGKQKRGSAKSSAKEGSSHKGKTKKIPISKKTSPPPKKATAKNDMNVESLSDKKKGETIKKSSDKKEEEQPKQSTDKKKDESIKKSANKKKDESIKKSSDKKKDEPVKKASDKKKEEEPFKKPTTPKKTTTPKKSSPKEGTGKKVLKVQEKPKEETPKPSDDDLRNSISKILKEVDFNTATFTDILKLLTEEFSTDLTERKSTIKVMIQDELSKLADEEDGDDEEDEDVAAAAAG